jgi:hypothetical protein
MGFALTRTRWRVPDRYATARSFAQHWTLLAALAFSIAGCHSIPPIDTKPLDDAGMTYDSIGQLKALNITAPEVTQIAAARGAGLSDSTCLALFKIFHDRKQPFAAGDAAAGLFRAQVSESTILELAKLDELGLPAGEFEAMRLAGLSDATLLAVARHRAANEPVLSGASLAGLKNAGVRESTLLELARRGVPDSKAGEISYFRRHGGTDAEILGHFTGS